MLSLDRKLLPRRRRRGKFGNKISKVGQFRYLSNLERDRHQQLQLLEKAGQIEDLRWQVPYRLEVGGLLICRYVADATYLLDGELVIEEIKGRWTDVAKLKKKLFEAIHTPQKLTVVTREEVYGGRTTRRIATEPFLPRRTS